MERSFEIAGETVVRMHSQRKGIEGYSHAVEDVFISGTARLIKYVVRVS